jgi:hypothetical protein
MLVAETAPASERGRSKVEGSQEMTVIDRSKFKHDERFGVYRGRFAVDGQKFEAMVTVPEKRTERAWVVTEKAIDLVLNRFNTIEKEIEKGLATSLVMWIEKEVEVTMTSRGKLYIKLAG